MKTFNIPPLVNFSIIPLASYCVLPEDKDAGARFNGQHRPVYRISHEPATEYQLSVGIRSLPGYMCDMVFLYAGLMPSLSHDAKIYGLMKLLAQLQEHVDGHFDVITEIMGITDDMVNQASQLMSMDTLSLAWLRAV